MAGINCKSESEGKKGAFAVLDTAYLINSNAERIHLCRRKLVEVWVVLWRHMVEFQDCRQTQSADLLRAGGEEMALLAIRVCLQCCARFFFLQNTKLPLPAHVKEGAQLPKGENKAFHL